MRTSVVASLGLSACALFIGCAAPTGPTAEDGAAYLGLVVDTKLTYESSNGTTETHDLVNSDLQQLGALSVGLTARENGFAVEEHSLTFGVDVNEASLLRFFNCLSKCAVSDVPISFVQWPLEEDQVTTGEGSITEVVDGEVVQTRVERHTTTVGPLADVTVPAGTFPAHLINWSRTTVDGTGVDVGTETTVLQWAPDVGIVRYEYDDGVKLELSSR